MDIYEFRQGNFNFSEDTNVAESFEVEGLTHLSLKKLSFLWSAGFGITGLEVYDDGDHKEYNLYYFNGNFYVQSITKKVYDIWCSILLQIQDRPNLISAFTIESTTINPYLLKTLFSRSICFISAEKSPNKHDSDEIKNEKERLNRINTAELYNTLKEKYFPIKLQGMFKENRKPEKAEISFLVVSRKGQTENEFIKDMYDLGVKYKQDSILIREKDKRNAYYLGTSNVEKPDIYAPGLGKKGQFGELLPYNIDRFYSIPFNMKRLEKRRNGKTAIRRKDNGDTFSYVDYKKPPKFNSKFWKKIDVNLYEYSREGYPRWYKWKVIRGEEIFGGIERSAGQALNLIKRIKNSAILSNLKIGELKRC